MLAIHSKLFILLSILCFQAVAANWKDGKCNYVNHKSDFNTSEFMGRWYLQSRSPGAGDQKICLQLIFHEISFLTWPTTLLYVRSEGKSKVKFDLRTNGSGAYGITPRKHYYNILETDYKNYATFYACPINGNAQEENIFIFTREKHPDGLYISLAENSFNRNGLEPNELIKIEQDSCPSDEEWAEMKEVDFIESEN